MLRVVEHVVGDLGLHEPAEDLDLDGGAALESGGQLRRARRCGER